MMNRIRELLMLRMGVNEGIGRWRDLLWSLLGPCLDFFFENVVKVGPDLPRARDEDVGGGYQG